MSEINVTFAKCMCVLNASALKKIKSGNLPKTNKYGKTRTAHQKRDKT